MMQIKNKNVTKNFSYEKDYPISTYNLDDGWV